MSYVSRWLCILVYMFRALDQDLGIVRLSKLSIIRIPRYHLSIQTRIKHELMPIRGSESTRRAASSGFLATNRHLRMIYLA